MRSMVAIYSDGQPVVVSALSEFMMENDLSHEQLQKMLRLLQGGQPAVFGGGAAPIVAVKLYRDGDENLTLDDVLAGEHA